VYLIAAATVMLSCLESRVHVSIPSTRKITTLSAVPHNTSSGYLVKPSAVHLANEQSHIVDKNDFFKLLCLSPAETSDLNGHSDRNAAVECNVIVIDDEDEEEQIDQNQDSCKTDLYGTTRHLRGDLEANGNASSRLLQPNGRLRKLLSIDISSNLGSRVLRNVMSTIKSDGLPLNPYTVSHSLSGSDHTLDYGTFCRTPVKGVNIGRLRHREFPVKYRSTSASTHYHYYCLTRADRRRFCRRFDTGLSGRSRRLRRKYGHCSVTMERLTDEEISDWRSSQRLRDYVTRMQEKEQENAAALNWANAADDDIISLSSDSEDDLPLAVRKQDRMFRCHQCDIKLLCSDDFRSLICDHYRTQHNIVNIDIISIVQPDGSVAMQIVHMPPPMEQRPPVVNSGSPIDLCSSETSITPPPEDSNCSYNPRPNPGQNTVSPPVPVEAESVSRMQPSEAGEPMVAYNHPQSDMLTELQNSIQPSVVPVLSLPQKLIQNSTLLNGSAHCRGDAVSSPSSVPSSCDADIICLD